jgi:hypothetical protein
LLSVNPNDWNLITYHEKKNKRPRGHIAHLSHIS